MPTKKELQANAAKIADTLSSQFAKKGYDGTAQKTPTRLRHANAALLKMSKSTARLRHANAALSEMSTLRARFRHAKVTGKKLTKGDTRTQNKSMRDSVNSVKSYSIIAGQKAGSKAEKGARATLEHSDSQFSMNKKTGKLERSFGNKKLVRASKNTPAILSKGQQVTTRTGKKYTIKHTWKSRKALIVGAVLGKATNYKIGGGLAAIQGVVSREKLKRFSKLINRRRGENRKKA